MPIIHTQSIACPSVDKTQLKQKLRFEKSLSKNAFLLKLLNSYLISTKFIRKECNGCFDAT